MEGLRSMLRRYFLSELFIPKWHLVPIISSQTAAELDVQDLSHVVSVQRPMSQDVEGIVVVYVLPKTGRGNIFGAGGSFTDTWAATSRAPHPRLSIIVGTPDSFPALNTERFFEFRGCHYVEDDPKVVMNALKSCRPPAVGGQPLMFLTLKPRIVAIEVHRWLMATLRRYACCGHAGDDDHGRLVLPPPEWLPLQCLSQTSPGTKMRHRGGGVNALRGGLVVLEFGAAGTSGTLPTTPPAVESGGAGSSAHRRDAHAVPAAADTGGIMSGGDGGNVVTSSWPAATAYVGDGMPGGASGGGDVAAAASAGAGAGMSGGDGGDSGGGDVAAAASAGAGAGMSGGDGGDSGGGDVAASSAGTGPFATRDYHMHITGNAWDDSNLTLVRLPSAYLISFDAVFIAPSGTEHSARLAWPDPQGRFSMLVLRLSDSDAPVPPRY